MSETIKNEIRKVIEDSKIAYVASIDSEQYPNIKAMLALHHDGTNVHYFSTNFSAKRTGQFIKNPKASVYYCNTAEFRGVLLTGEMEVLTDTDHKKMLWRDGFEMYYPKGIEDDDYCVFKFTALKVNYYHGLQNHTFSADEF